VIHASRGESASSLSFQVLTKAPSARFCIPSCPLWFKLFLFSRATLNTSVVGFNSGGMQIFVGGLLRAATQLR
jgi:hypothetical protein